MTNEWHVRALSGQLDVWEVWFEDRLLTRAPMNEAWGTAKREARLAGGQAFLYYRHRSDIQEAVDFRAPRPMA
jgi:hypothetical protein